MRNTIDVTETDCDQTAIGLSLSDLSPSLVCVCVCVCVCVNPSITLPQYFIKCQYPRRVIPEVKQRSLNLVIGWVIIIYYLELLLLLRKAR
jgi:hypothetical protein